MSVTIQTGNVVKIQSGNRVLISAPGPQGPAGADGGAADPWSPNSFVFIDPVNGNDTTGDGTSALPWATANKAFTEGYYNYFIAPGDAGSITYTGYSGVDFYIAGLAANDFIDTSGGTPWAPTPLNFPVTQMEFICNGADNQHVHIFSNKGVTINLTGNSSGLTGPDFSVYNAVIGTVNLAGVNGGAGEDGGIGGLLSLDECLVLGDVNCDAGQAGDGGNPGNGGIINFRQCQVRGAVSALGYGGISSEVNALLSSFNIAPVADSISLRSCLVDGVSKFSEASFVVTGGGSNSVSLVAPSSIPASKLFYLPGADGASGQPLMTNGAGTLSFGTLGVAGGGTSSTTLTANAVLLGNGTSALQTVAPSTSGNVLTSNGTTWTSAAPTTGANPAGSGSELQFRSNATTFGAVTGSSVSGANLTLGGLLTVTPAAANTGFFSGTGYSLTGSDTTAMLNLAGTWNTTGIANGIRLDVTDTASNANSLLMHLTVGGANRFRLFKDGGLFCAGTVNGTNINASTYFGGGDSGQFILGASLDTRLQRDAAAVWAMRNGANAHTLRIYETDSGANDEYLELTAASGTNLIRPQATGTGTASVVRYHTTTAVFWTSGSGSPESVVTAPIGSLYTRTDGGASTTLYVKESGTGSTGWIAK
jgi:hypothetical protein